MLWLDMGLGKTIASLTNIVERQNLVQVYGTLVVAPLRVIQTVWRQEAAQWSHTKHLRFSVIHGAPDERVRAYQIPADVYLVNYEGLPWLCQQLIHTYLSRGRHLPFNQMIFDEISKLKDPMTSRHESIRSIVPFCPYRIGLTGTPAANGFMDLFGQYLVIDMGTRLGDVPSNFKEKYFNKNNWGMGSKYEVAIGAEDRIKAQIEGITMQMSAADYLDLPPIKFNDIWVDLPPKARAEYERLERDMFMELDSGAEVEVFNAASLINKCLQAANGAAYVETGGPWDRLHDAKLDALEDIVEEAAGKPLLLSYSFRHDAARIEKHLKGVHPINSKLGDAKINQLVEQWNAGKVPILLGHPASMGHGLNLQHGGDTIVMFGLPWSLEQYEQVINRLAGGLRRYRPIVVHRILARNTADEAVRLALAAKATTQDGLKVALNEYRREKTNPGQGYQKSHPGAEAPRLASW